MTTPLRIATRGSELALRRARVLQALLAGREMESELVPLRTAGDKHFEDDVPAAITKSAFTRELDTALLKRRAELAVHALSDVSTDPTPGLRLVAVLARDDPRDALIVNRLVQVPTLAELPRGSRIGTSSVRCRALLRATFPDLEVVHLRGDLRTRLHKLDAGQVHGAIVPLAALQRLDVTQHLTFTLDPPGWLPAPAQGAVGVYAREDDAAACAAVEPFDDLRAHADVRAERAVLASLEGGLQSAVGALVHATGDARVLHALIADADGRAVLRAGRAMEAAEPELLGVRLANDLRAMGASRMLDAQRRRDRTPAPQPDS